MASEQTEQADAADITQQATTPTPTTQPVKSPRRVATGKVAAQKTKEARETQEMALAETEEKAKKAEAKAAAAKAAPPAVAPVAEEKPSSGLTTTQWLTLGSIIVGLIWIYYKLEEIKAAIKPRVRWEFTTAEKQESPESPAPRSTIPRPAVRRGCCQIE